MEPMVAVAAVVVAAVVVAADNRVVVAHFALVENVEEAVVEDKENDAVVDTWQSAHRVVVVHNTLAAVAWVECARWVV